MTTTAEYQRRIAADLSDLATMYRAEGMLADNVTPEPWFAVQAETLCSLAEVVYDGGCDIMTGSLFVEAGRALLVRIQTTRLARDKSKSSMDQPQPLNLRALADDVCTCTDCRFGLTAAQEQALMDEVHASRAARRQPVEFRGTRLYVVRATLPEALAWADKNDIDRERVFATTQNPSVLHGQSARVEWVELDPARRLTPKTEASWVEQIRLVQLTHLTIDGFDR